MQETNSNEFKVKLNNQEITIRKWKAKEKLAFKEIMKDKDSDKSKLVDILVYNCIEEDVAFSKDEYKYVLSKIRSLSLGDEIPLQFTCDECNEQFIEQIIISEVIRPSFKEIKTIETKNFEIQLGKIRNTNYYKSVVNQSPNELDFYLRVQSINGNDGYTLEEIIDYFENMDVQDFDEIFEQWDQIKFKIEDTKIIECPHCSNKVKYEFDDIPGFFPASWYN